MYRFDLFSTTTLLACFAGLAATGCAPEGAPEPRELPTVTDSADEVVTLRRELTFTDGAGEERLALVRDVALLEGGDTLRYRLQLDGQARIVTYGLAEGPQTLLVVVDGPDDQTEEIALRVGAHDVEMAIRGETIGVFARGEGEHAPTALHADPLSFAALSLFPHQVQGLTPGELFAGYSAYETGEGGIDRVRQGKITLKGVLQAIGGLFSGGARADCVKNPDISSCDVPCAIVTDTPQGGPCGAIPCCAGGCEVVEGGYSYGVEVGSGG